VELAVDAEEGVVGCVETDPDVDWPSEEVSAGSEVVVFMLSI
jgi:hypothetical protein